MARRLDGEEKALWGKVISTVKPMHPVKAAATAALKANSAATAKPKIDKQISSLREAKPRSNLGQGQATLDCFASLAMTNFKTPGATLQQTKPPSSLPTNTLDGSWDRRIGKGAIIPDISVDLHGQGLTSAYARLDGALEQAIAQKMRVILLVTGKARSHDRTSGEGRGAIASVVRDWLAASRHSASISAVRNSHPRHGGTGALYIVLKR